jgi:hypothetical protein
VIGIAAVVMIALALVNGVDSVSDLVSILLMGVSLAVAAVPEGSLAACAPHHVEQDYSAC